MHRYEVLISGQRYQVEFDWLQPGGSRMSAQVDGETVEVVFPPALNVENDLDWVVVDGCTYEITFDRDLRWIRDFNGVHDVHVRDLNQPEMRLQRSDGMVRSPIPGQISHIYVVPGQVVTAGEALLILEAMKMQNEIRAPNAGKILTIHVEAGNTVGRGQVLIELEAIRSVQ